MRTILITLDSLNRHFLSRYGGPVDMPALDRLGDAGCTFNGHFTGSAPCIPARREMLTGTLELRHRGWGPLEPFDRTLPKMLSEKGVPSMLITDHYHYFENGGENYHVDFTGYEFIRGHESDNWKTFPYDDGETLNPQTHTVPAHERNRQTFQSKEEYPCARTFAAAEEWVRENVDTEEFFLYIDEFDPHEPFFVPQEYLDRVDNSGYEGPRLEWPKYGSWNGDDVELSHLRRRYTAKLLFLNDLLESFFSLLEAKGMYDDTTIICTTDHGHYLGEHGNIGKPGTDNWNTLFHIPMVCKPAAGLGAVGGRYTNALTTTADLCATVADLHQLDFDPSLYGRSFFPLLTGEAEQTREYVLYGYFGGQLSYCDGSYSFHKRPGEPNAPLHLYTTRLTTHPSKTPALQELFRLSDEKEIDAFLKDTDYPVIRLAVPLDAQLSWCADHYMPDTAFDLYADPEQERPLRDPILLARLRQEMIAAMSRERFPPEQFERLSLV
jgi:arylsulfatase A-like enzyme